MCGVSFSHRGHGDQHDHASRGSRRADADPPEAPSSPRARRTRVARWRDPRLWIGVVLVLAGVVGGAKLLAAADETVPVWSAAHEIHAGATVAPQDLVRTDVHFTDRRTRQRYLAGEEQIPADARAVHDIAAGELIRRGVLAAEDRDAKQLPLAVPPQGLPAGLAVGDRVAVWAVPDPSRSHHQPKRVLDDVAVVSMSSTARGGLSADRRVSVRLPGDVDVASVLRALGDSSVVLIRLGR